MHSGTWSWNIILKSTLWRFVIKSNVAQFRVINTLNIVYWYIHLHNQTLLGQPIRYALKVHSEITRFYDFIKKARLYSAFPCTDRGHFNYKCGKGVGRKISEVSWMYRKRVERYNFISLRIVPRCFADEILKPGSMSKLWTSAIQFWLCLQTRNIFV